DTFEEDRVFVLDAGNYRVQVIDEDGDYISQWGKRGKGDGEFDDPVTLVVDEDNEVIYTLDREKVRVDKFTLEGEHLLSFGEEGLRKGRLRDPVDLTVDYQGYVYVLDRGRGAVLKYHRSGTFVDEWGDLGRRSKEFQDPVSLAFSRKRLGTICVLDRGRRALINFDRKGNFEEIVPLEEAFPGGENPLRVRSDERGDLFILDGNQGKLVWLRDSKIHVFGLTSEKGSMESPAGLAVDEEGRIYVSDIKRNRIFRYILEPN
ncbi:MAG: NHL repeat-containing protein, partial [bacterium]